ncbi:YhbY family RNA-binding protein [Lactobacillus terrae]|uniref:YhbY family RNA-binding protein n=1 Tax=Lactobacillus terrae TaxID=2269374 RepID=UPI000C1B7B99|nr:YhbY family RNA-binding protein [Lactobacillus terrae]
MIIKGKKNSYLRSKAQTMKPQVQIGKDGISQNLIDQIKQILEKNELIKVSLLQNTTVDSDELVEALQKEDDQIAHVQTIGSKVVLYKKSSKVKNRNYSIELEKM